MNHDFWLDVTKVDACRFVSMALLLLQKSVCMTLRRGKNVEKLGRRRSAQISVISVKLFLCDLYGMRFAILYGMFRVDRNLVLFSTELI